MFADPFVLLLGKRRIFLRKEKFLNVELCNYSTIFLNYLFIEKRDPFTFEKLISDSQALCSESST